MRLLLLLHLLLSSACLADGIALQHTPLPTPMPAQCAILSWRDGVESLVIRTDLDAQPGESAWIVPVPSIPDLFEVRPGAVESARASFVPRVASDPWADRAGLGIAVLILVALLHVVVMDRSRVWGRAATVAGLAILLFVAIMRPALGGARGIASAESAGVTLHERRMIGSSEVAVVSSSDPGALAAWVGRFGIAIPKEAEPVVADYCRDCWCFVAAKVQDPGAAGVHTPTPVGMKFAAAEPVYPMRLTAVGNRGASTPLDLELLVFGPGSATAPGMSVESSGPVEAIDDQAGIKQLMPPSSDAVRVSHRGVAPLVEGAAWATRLRGSFTPAGMSRDIKLTFGAGAVFGRAVFSESSRRWRACFAACLGLAVCGMLVLPVSRLRWWSRRRMVAAGVVGVLAAVASAGLAVRGMSVVPTRLTNALLLPSHILGAWYTVVIASPPPANAEQARGMFETALRARVDPTEAPTFGDGPGRYMIREVEGGLEFSWVNGFGQEWTDDSLRTQAR